jgi:DNA-binding transcriptional regulator YdaS (Cro superfamily)
MYSYTLAMKNKALTKIVKIMGSKAAIARALGITRDAVSKWQRVPSKHVIALELLTKVSRYEMRHDVYKQQSKAKDC